jgi:alkylation response protein AidB-like acyl-CoA dehydrogenase
MGLCDAMLAIEELGAHAVAQPVAEALGIVAPLLAKHAGDELCARWLPGLVDGSVMASIQEGWGGQAPWGVSAHLVLVPQEDETVALCVSDATTKTFAGAQDRARRPARLGPTSIVSVLAKGRVATELRDRARVVYAQLLLGLARAAIAQAVEYARLREQFGRPIGSFQAVKHMLADAHVAVQTARRATWYAAWCVDHDQPDRGESAALAKASAGEAALAASHAALQVHGAIGFTWQCDLHLWLKRIHVLEPLFGSAPTVWRELADTWFDGEAA